MTNRQFANLANRLLPEFPNFAVKSPLMFLTPVGHTLRGFCFESHRSSADYFYVWVFLLPIFIPRQHVSYEFGDRIGDRWDATTPDVIRDLTQALKRQGLPFLSTIRSPEDVVQTARQSSVPGDSYIRESIAYGLARAGDVEAASALNQLIHGLDLRVAWQREMADRARALEAKVLADPRAAQHQLDIWEGESIRNLGLGRHHLGKLPKGPVAGRVLGAK